MQDLGAVTAMAALLCFLFIVVKYPGQAMVGAGVLLLLGGALAQATAKTAFHEITAALGVVGGMIAVGLGLAVIQLAAIRGLIEAARGPVPTPPAPPAPSRPISQEEAAEAWRRHEEARRR